MIQDLPPFSNHTMAEMVSKHLNFTTDGKQYYPILYINDFWIMNEDLSIINDTVKSVTLHMKIDPLSFTYWSIYLSMEDNFQKQSMMFGGNADDSSDLFKHLILDNNPILVAFTFFITLVHSVLDCLALKNEIQFWRAKRSMEGLSIRTLYRQVICSIIVLLYLLDNSQQTSWLILGNIFVGLGLELWKISKAVIISVQRTTLYGIQNVPYLQFTEKQSYVSSTKEHDLVAMKYLNYALYPIILGYSIYSLYYGDHKNWYSWVIATLAGCVYTFGFIIMTPQLFINYKLKSVGHLPWRAFIYKAISTFIDDLFAFMIPMPTLHRLRVFRDDIVFIIYLYQRWIYPVDSTRIDAIDSFEDAPAEEMEKSKKITLNLTKSRKT